MFNVDLGLQSDGGVKASTCQASSWDVSSSPVIIVPTSPIRLYFSIYHEGAGDLLLGFASNALTATDFALALPPKFLLQSSTWAGQLRAIARSGTITVQIREFFP